MITVVCVYWQGPFSGEKERYPIWWIEKLKRMVAKHLPLEHRFVCMSNVEVPCERIPLENNWEGWWSKIELFRPGLFSGQVLYLDLDTVIVGSLEPLLEFGSLPFIGLRAFNPLKSSIISYMGSAILTWKTNGSFDFLYNEFDFQEHSSEFTGDQDYISAMLYRRKIKLAHWQVLVPGIYSYKRHIRKGTKLKDDPRIICFHGNPRPHTLIDNSLIQEAIS